MELILQIQLLLRRKSPISQIFLINFGIFTPYSLRITRQQLTRFSVYCIVSIIAHPQGSPMCLTDAILGQRENCEQTTLQ